MQGVDINELLSANAEGSFLDLCDFNQHSFGSCRITGVSPVWEMHPDTDEFFHILEGEMNICLLLDTGKEDVTVSAGSVFVVPRGVWHKPGAPDGASFVYFTPGQSLHSDAEDPRV